MSEHTTDSSLELGVCTCGHTKQQIELLKAQEDFKMRNRALSLSSALTVIWVTAHIYFAYEGRVLVMSEIMWAAIMSPWIGAGMSKLKLLTGGKK